MKLPAVIGLLGLAVSCVAVVAASTPAGAPTLSYTQQGDSVRVIARWKPVCDARGCADSTRLTWTVRGVARPVKHSRAAADTLWMPAPAWGDSAAVGVAVASVRRGLVSPARSAQTVVRRLDVAPPAPDSLRVDTLAALAFLDSYPEFPRIRTVSGARMATVAPGGALQFCTLTGRNRFTGAVHIVLPPDADVDTRHALERACEPARVAVATERAG